MRKLLIRGIMFICLLGILFYMNLYFFRCLIPKLWVVTLIGSVIILIKFPYEKFFKYKNKINEEE